MLRKHRPNLVSHRVQNKDKYYCGKEYFSRVCSILSNRNVAVESMDLGSWRIYLF